MWIWIAFSIYASSISNIAVVSHIFAHRIMNRKGFILKIMKKRENAACLFCTNGSTKYFDLLLLTLLCLSK